MARGKGEPQEQPRCWFCDDEGPLSAEHIIARSFISLFDQLPSEHREATIRHDRRYRDGDGRSTTKRAKGFANTTRRFCRRCNNGWMNELDDEVRPVLEAFAAGREITLPSETQGVLAAWVHKVALGYLSQELPHLQFAPRSDYHDFFATQRPPARGAQVWIGWNSHSGLGNLADFGSWSLNVFGSPAADRDTYGYGLSFGYADFIGMVHRSDTHRYRLRLDAHQRLREIWLPRPGPLSWPPPSTLPSTSRDFDPIVMLMGNQPNGFVALDDSAPDASGRTDDHAHS